MGLSPLYCLMTGRKSIYLTEETKAFHRAGRAGFHADWNLLRLFPTFPARELEIIKREYALNISSHLLPPLQFIEIVNANGKFAAMGWEYTSAGRKALNVFHLEKPAQSLRTEMLRL